MLKLTEGCVWGQLRTIFFGVLRRRRKIYNIEVREEVGRGEYFSLLFIPLCLLAHFLSIKHSLP